MAEVRPPGLTQEQRDLLKALPRKAEIPTFLSNLQEQAERQLLMIITTVGLLGIIGAILAKTPLR